MLAGLGDELVGDAVGVGGMGDLGEGRPKGAAGIERIEDDVAALGPVIMRDELAAGVIDQRGFAARLDPVEQLAQGGGLAAAGRADHRHVPGFQPRRDRHRCRWRARGHPHACARQLGKPLLGRDQRSGDDAIPQRPLAPPPVAPRKRIRPDSQAAKPSQQPRTMSVSVAWAAPR